MARLGRTYTRPVIRSAVPSAGTNNTLTAPLGTLTLTQLLPTITQGNTLAAVLGTLTLTELVPTIGQGNTLIPPLGTVTLTQLLPTIGQGNTLAAVLGTITLTGLDPTFDQSGPNSITAPLGMLSLLGLLPAIEQTQFGKGAGVGRRRKVCVKVDDQLFEYTDEAEALALFAQLRALAEETAPKVAAKAVKRLERAKTPAAVARAEVLPIPRIALAELAPDEFSQRVQAQIDAVRAQIAGMYADAVKAAQKQAKQDEDDVLEILAMDADEDEKIVSQFLKTLKKRK